MQNSTFEVSKFFYISNVKNNNLGKPQVKLHNKALDRYKRISSGFKTSIELSISDERDYSIANVMIFKNEK